MPEGILHYCKITGDGNPLCGQINGVSIALLTLVLPYGQPFLFLLTFAYTTTSKLILLHQECKLTYDYQQIFLVDILVM